MTDVMPRPKPAHWHGLSLPCKDRYHRHIGRGTKLQATLLDDGADHLVVLSEGFDVFGRHVGWVGPVDVDGRKVGPPRWVRLCT